MNSNKSEIPKRINLLGVGINDINMPQALSLGLEKAKEKNGAYICVTGMHGVMESQSDLALAKVHNNSFLVLPDGMPTVWWGKLNGFKNIERVYGPDFMLAVCESSVGRNQTHFLYGGKAGVVERLKLELENRFPGIQIVGMFTPPFRSLDSSEEKELEAQVAELAPDFFWVGLGTPKQERFVSSHQHLKTGLLVGVGAAFDIHTGRINDSPSWLKKLGLQWLHRLCQEPRRLWRRYLIFIPLFVWNIFKQFFKLKKFPLVN